MTLDFNKFKNDSESTLKYATLMTLTPTSQPCSKCSFAIQKHCLSFERGSTLGQSQTELGPRVYAFTTPGCCTVQIRCGSDNVEQH